MGKDREEGAVRIGPSAPPDAGAKAPPARRLLLWLPVALMLGVQVWLSSQSRLPRVLPSFHGVDKLEHGAWFFVAALFAWNAGRAAEGWGRGRRVATLLLAFALWGVSDEAHQWFVPGRAVEAGDVAADVAGTVLALAAAELRLRAAEPLPPP